MLRVLIADDEPNHRLGLTRHINWNDLGYEIPLQAEDAQEALEIAMKTPIDVLIADVCMPGMDGIELVRRLRLQYPQIPVLIISGYEEFEFARSAVEAGAKAYLLKPLKIEEVEKWLKIFSNEIHLARQAAEADLQIKKKLKNSYQIARERFLEELLDGVYQDEDKLNRKLELLDLPVSRFSYRLAIVSLDDYAVIMEKDPQTGPTLIHRIMNMLPAVLDDYDAISVKTGLNQSTVLIINKPDVEYDINSGLDSRFEIIQRSFKENPWISVSVCISREGCQWSQIHALKREALYILNTSRLYEKGQIVWVENTKTEEFLEEFNIVKVFSNMMELVQEMDLDGISNLLNECFEPFLREDRYSLSFIQSFSLGIISQILRTSEIAGFQMKMPYHELCIRILGCISAEELKNATSEIVLDYLKDFYEYQCQKKSQTIENVSRYLREHLEENTTVKELSEIVHMNPSYLSVLFKKEMGETISDFVNRIRIERARELLQQDYKIYDIAQKVGYQNPSYFANQFKKAMGVTPADYRKLMS